MSEKLDGIRAIWENGFFWTRNGNKIAVPDEFLARKWIPLFALKGKYGGATATQISTK